MSNIQKQHKISPAIAWLTIQKFIIFYCPLDGEHTNRHYLLFPGIFCVPAFLMDFYEQNLFSMISGIGDVIGHHHGKLEGQCILKGTDIQAKPLL